MLSLETAKKLKSAGLRWDAAIGDRYYICYPRSSFVGESIVSSKDLGTYLELDDKYIFAPRLEQLLEEIRKRGYRWDIGNLGYLRDKDICIGLFDDETRIYVTQFLGDIPEEVAAQALIWILEQGKGCNT